MDGVTRESHLGSFSAEFWLIRLKSPGMMHELYARCIEDIFDAKNTISNEEESENAECLYPHSKFHNGTSYAPVQHYYDYCAKKQSGFAKTYTLTIYVHSIKQANSIYDKSTGSLLIEINYTSSSLLKESTEAKNPIGQNTVSEVEIFPLFKFKRQEFCQNKC